MKILTKLIILKKLTFLKIREIKIQNVPILKKKLSKLDFPFIYIYNNKKIVGVGITFNEFINKLRGC